MKVFTGGRVSGLSVLSLRYLIWGRRLKRVGQTLQTKPYPQTPTPDFQIDLGLLK